LPVFETLDGLTNYVSVVTIPEMSVMASAIVKKELNQQVEDRVYGDVFNGIGDGNAYEHTFGLRDTAMSVISRYGNGIYNDDQYEYDQIGVPFMAELGRKIYEHELKRKKKLVPDLSSFEKLFDK